MPIETQAKYAEGDRVETHAGGMGLINHVFPSSKRTARGDEPIWCYLVKIADHIELIEENAIKGKVPVPASGANE